MMAVTLLIGLGLVCDHVEAQTTTPAAKGLPTGPVTRTTGDPPHQGPHPHIPCVCLFQGRQFRLGDIVCMNTFRGTVLTRCELVLNNTSWTPSDDPCTVSDAGRAMTRLAGR